MSDPLDNAPGLAAREQEALHNLRLVMSRYVMATEVGETVRPSNRVWHRAKPLSVGSDADLVGVEAALVADWVCGRPRPTTTAASMTSRTSRNSRTSEV